MAKRKKKSDFLVRKIMTALMEQSERMRMEEDQALKAEQYEKVSGLQECRLVLYRELCTWIRHRPEVFAQHPNRLFYSFLLWWV